MEEPLAWDGPLAEKVDYIVDDGGPALIRYNFNNPGKEGVRFIEAKASCRCTTIELPKGEFPPGSSGTITFQLAIDDTPGHVVSSEGYIGYSYGTRKYAHVLKLAVNKRPPLQWEPKILELEEVVGPGSSHCEGWLSLTRYTTPGRPFLDYRFVSSDFVGGATIAEDERWGPVQQDGGYLKSTRKLLLRTKPDAPSSGTASLNFVSGDPPIGKDSVAVHWSRQNFASIEPETVLLSADRPSCKIQIVSHCGLPRNASWKVPKGFEVVRSDDVEREGEISIILSLNKAGLKSKYPLTESFTIILDYGDRSIELGGTIVVLSAP